MVACRVMIMSEKHVQISLLYVNHIRTPVYVYVYVMYVSIYTCLVLFQSRQTRVFYIQKPQILVRLMKAGEECKCLWWVSSRRQVMMMSVEKSVHDLRAPQFYISSNLACFIVYVQTYNYDACTALRCTHGIQFGCDEN